jgi:hypothetical protein
VPVATAARPAIFAVEAARPVSAISCTAAPRIAMRLSQLCLDCQMAQTTHRKREYLCYGCTVYRAVHPYLSSARSIITVASAWRCNRTCTLIASATAAQICLRTAGQPGSGAGPRGPCVRVQPQNQRHQEDRGSSALRVLIISTMNDDHNSAVVGMTNDKRLNGV